MEGGNTAVGGWAARALVATYAALAVWFCLASSREWSAPATQSYRWGIP
jgi:hypothetical protein